MTNKRWCRHSREGGSPVDPIRTRMPRTERGAPEEAAGTGSVPVPGPGPELGLKRGTQGREQRRWPRRLQDCSALYIARATLPAPPVRKGRPCWIERRGRRVACPQVRFNPLALASPPFPSRWGGVSPRERSGVPFVSADHVRGPTMPSGRNPCRRWNPLQPPPASPVRTGRLPREDDPPRSADAAPSSPHGAST